MSKNVAVFVDVANVYYAAKSAGVDVDYPTLLKGAVKGRDLIRAYAYSGLDPDNESQRRFIDFLGKNGFRVVYKDIRKYGDGKIKANLDIELVVDLFRLADRMDIAVIVSGDGDFAPAIRALQDRGVRAEVISFRGNTSSDLIQVADEFIDIMKVVQVGRTKKDVVVTAPEMPAKEVVPEFGFREAPPSVAEAARAALRAGGRTSRTRTDGRRGSPPAVIAAALGSEEQERAERGEIPFDEEELVQTAGEPVEGRSRRRRRRGGRGRGGGFGDRAVEGTAHQTEPGWEEFDALSAVDDLAGDREYSFTEADQQTLAELGLLEVTGSETDGRAGAAGLNADESAETARRRTRRGRRGGRGRRRGEDARDDGRDDEGLVGAPGEPAAAREPGAPVAGRAAGEAGDGDIEPQPAAERGTRSRRAPPRRAPARGRASTEAEAPSHEAGEPAAAPAGDERGGAATAPEGAADAAPRARTRRQARPRTAAGEAGPDASSQSVTAAPGERAPEEPARERGGRRTSRTGRRQPTGAVDGQPTPDASTAAPTTEEPGAPRPSRRRTATRANAASSAGQAGGSAVEEGAGETATRARPARRTPGRSRAPDVPASTAGDQSARATPPADVPEPRPAGRSRRTPVTAGSGRGERERARADSESDAAGTRGRRPRTGGRARAAAAGDSQPEAQRSGEEPASGEAGSGNEEEPRGIWGRLVAGRRK